MSNVVNYLEVEDQERLSDLEENECRNEWATNQEAVKRILNFGARLGLDHDDILSALTGSDADEDLVSFRQFVGDLEYARELVSLYAVERVNNALWDLQKRSKPSEHAEAPVVAWSEVWLPGGGKVSVTARSGSTVDEVMEVTLTLASAINQLRDFGIKTK